MALIFNINKSVSQQTSIFKLNGVANIIENNAEPQTIEANFSQEEPDNLITQPAYQPKQSRQVLFFPRFSTTTPPLPECIESSGSGFLEALNYKKYHFNSNTMKWEVVYS